MKIISLMAVILLMIVGCNNVPDKIYYSDSDTKVYTENSMVYKQILNTECKFVFLTKSDSAGMAVVYGIDVNHPVSIICGIQKDVPFMSVSNLANRTSSELVGKKGDDLYDIAKAIIRACDDTHLLAIGCNNTPDKIYYSDSDTKVYTENGIVYQQYLGTGSKYVFHTKVDSADVTTVSSINIDINQPVRVIYSINEDVVVTSVHNLAVGPLERVTGKKGDNLCKMVKAVIRAYDDTH